MVDEPTKRYELGDEPPIHITPERVIRVYIDHGVVLDMNVDQARELGIALIEVAAQTRQRADD